MRITRLQTLCLSRLHESERQWFTSRYRTIKADCAIVVIHTDSEMVGVGEASAYGGPLLIREWVDWLAPELIGRSPVDPAVALHPNGLACAHDAAVAGIDCALWDLRGKVAGVPTCSLLADHPQTRVRLYASSGCRYDWRNHPEQLIQEALECISLGYSAYKFRLGTEWSWDGVTVDRFLGLVRELVQAVAGRIELMLDGNMRLTEEQALVIAKELERSRFAWFEEPIPANQIEGYCRLCAAVDLPISGGEGFTTLEQFRPYLEKHAYDIVQPDAGICGISEAIRIARMAERYGIELIPHSWHNGLMALANAHLLAALLIPHPLEQCMIQGPLQWGILAKTPSIEQGWLMLPEASGLGADLAADLENRFPYIEGHYAIEVQR
jgi:L-alanine-DL-glutamate epimerase-like enolase superfamily enzyme